MFSICLAFSSSFIAESKWDVGGTIVLGRPLCIWLCESGRDHGFGIMVTVGLVGGKLQTTVSASNFYYFFSVQRTEFKYI